MKLRSILLILFFALLLAALGLFVTKPSDLTLSERAETFLSRELAKDMPEEYLRSPHAQEVVAVMARKSLTIEDMFFYKKVVLTRSSGSRVIGYGYFNDFHPAKERAE